MLNIIPPSGVEKQAAVHRGQPGVSRRRKDVLTLLHLVAFQHKAVSRPAPCTARRVMERQQQASSPNPSPPAPQLTPPGPTSCGHCWLLGCPPTPRSQLLGQAPGLKQEPASAWEGCARPRPTASPNAASHGRLPHCPSHLSPPWLLSLPAGSVSEALCQLDAKVGRGGIQEAAGRLILLIICSMQDGVEN